MQISINSVGECSPYPLLIIFNKKLNWNPDQGNINASKRKKFAKKSPGADSGEVFLTKFQAKKKSIAENKIGGESIANTNLSDLTNFTDIYRK